jgi:hypothetical protein
MVVWYYTYVVIVWYDGLHCFLKTLGNAKFNVISVLPIDVIVLVYWII